MFDLKFTRAATVLAGMGLVLCTSWAETKNEKEQIAPEALNILKKSTDFLSALQQFSADTENSLDHVYSSGQKLQYNFHAHIAIRRPNRLHARRRGAGLDQTFVYDGKTLSIHDAIASVYAWESAPDNIDDLLHFARDTLGLVPPVGDLIFSNSFDLLTAGLTSGAVVGKALIHGIRCDHLAFRNPVVDWQIWIAEGDQPLPRKFVLTTRDDPERPQYTVEMNNWDASPKLDEAMFQVTAQPNAKRVDFLRVDNASNTKP